MVLGGIFMPYNSFKKIFRAMGGIESFSSLFAKASLNRFAVDEVILDIVPS